MVTPDTAPLSSTQMGIYAESTSFPESTLYNIPFMGTIGPDISIDRFQSAIEQTVMAHPGLNVRLYLGEDGQVMQRICDEPCPVEVISLSDAQFEARKAALVRPFDLLGGRLFRFEIYITPTQRYFFQDIHHIIFDLSSLEIFTRDICAAYDGQALKTESFSGLDIARQERTDADSDAMTKARQHFAALLDGRDADSLPVREIYEKTPRQGWLSREFSVDPAAFKALRKESGVSTTAFFTAVMGFLMAKYNYREDSVITTVYNGRKSPQTADTVSMLVKTLPFVTDLRGNPAIRELLQQATAQLAASRESDLCPFSEIAAQYAVTSDVTVVYQGRLLEQRIGGNLNIPLERIYDANHIEKTALLAEIGELGGGRYLLHLGYRADLFSRDFAENFSAAYALAAQEFLTKSTADDVLLADAAAVAKLDAFQAAASDYDREKTVIDLFREQAKLRPERTALVYRDEAYTYRQLDELTDRLAMDLRRRGIGREQVVGVLIPRNAYMAICSLGILKAGGAYLPLDSTYPPERLALMMADSGAKALITTPELSSLIPESPDCLRIMTDQIPHMPDTGTVLPPPANNDLFVMLYTSGSTGTPKGVMLEHGNIAAFCAWATGYYAIGQDTVSAVYASYGFDAHMHDLYPPLLRGGCVHIIDEDIRLDLIALQNYFNENGVTHSFITTQVGRQFAQLDGTRTLRHLSVGGEKLVPLDPPPYAMHNGYGPTECTIFATIAQVDRKYEDIPIGHGLNGLKLYVVDKQGHLLPPGAAGELWIAGPQVGRCYCGRPELTAKAFTPNPFCDAPDCSRVYHTGDVVRFLGDGALQFIGRRDSQVKIRGFRIELTEVEEIIRRFPGIKDAAVVALDAPSGGKMLVAYVVSDEKVDISAMNAFILGEKPPYMVPGITMQIDKIPLNANSKVDKRKLPAPKAAPVETVDTGRAQTQLEQEISDVVAEVLGHRDFGVETHFVHAGLTSISAIRLAAELTKHFGTGPNVKELLGGATILTVENALVNHWRTASRPAPEQPSAQRDAYPLTQTQLGIYLACRMDAESDMYNIPILMQLDPVIEEARLDRAIHDAVEAHPFLKCRMEERSDGSAVMIPQPDLTWQIPRSRCTEEEIAARCGSIPSIITLERKQLFDFELLRTDAHLYLWMNLHHIIMDGSSVSILLEDIEQAYLGQTPEPEAYTSFDLALDEEKTRQTQAFAQAKAYYDSVFEGISARSLPAADVTDLPEGAATLCFPMAQLRPGEIQTFCEKTGITPNVLFMAAFGVLLGKVTGQTESLFASIYNGRTDPRTFRMLGMLVKTYPIHMEWDEKCRVDAFLQAVRQRISQLTANDLFSFAEASRAYGVNADILFAYQGDSFDATTFAGKAATFPETRLSGAKAPLSVDVLCGSAGCSVSIEYRADLYAADSIRWMADAYQQIVLGMLHAETLADIDPTSEAALDYLELCNDTAWPVPSRPACTLMEQSAARYPDRLAVVTSRETLTYRQLDENANRLANGLIAAGIQPGDIVALMLPRSAQVYITRQGILKAGGAFLSIDPQYPDDRIAYMLQDSGAKALIVDSEAMEDRSPFLRALDCAVYTADALLRNPNHQSPGISRADHDPCYCIYTSGSTGKPKGVLLSQRNLVNFVDANPKNHEILGFTQRTHVSLALAAFTFDVSILEEFIPLATGMTICMAGEEELHDPMALAALMQAHHVDMMTCTPSFLANIIDLDVMRAPLSNVASYDLGAESFPPSLLAKIRGICPDAHIMNGYGPTETTISCTMDVVTDHRRITIGRPGANVKAYVVDEKLRILPPRMRGELVICGDGVGLGYMGREDLTREKFITLRGMRAYRTGDLAEFSHDGLLLFHGRTDNQVKLRGLRVELGEIENAINAYPGIITSIVQVCGEGSHQFLAAWYTASCSIDPEQLQAQISKTLTHYMVPRVLTQLPEMPLTANGKIDKKKLPKPDASLAHRPYTPPANAVETDFCDLFGEILQLEQVGAEDDFFELGGTSLSASRIAMFAMKKGYRIVYADVFKHPTARGLAALVLEAKTDIPQNRPDILRYDYNKLSSILAFNKESNLDAIEPGQLGNVLITGATGFLGVHVLWRYLDSYEDGIAYCLLRRGDQPSVEERLRSVLSYYFSDQLDSYFASGRIRCIDGDITIPDTLRQLDDLDIQTVINCAAVVKHFDAGDELERVNVQGVRNLIDCCMEYHRRLIQVSTVSIAGESVDGVPDEEKKLHEHELFFGQLLENEYVHSKFCAEREVLDAISRGLDGKIMRVGNLMARFLDEKFQINFRSNGFLRQLRGYRLLGAFPMSEMSRNMEFSEIGMTAEAIVRLSGTDRRFTVFHPCNNHLVTMADVIYIMQQRGFPIEVVSDRQFQQILDAAAEKPEMSDAVGGLIAYRTADGSMQRCALDASLRYTTEALFRLAFKWPITSPIYLRNMIASLKDLGMF